MCYILGFIILDEASPFVFIHARSYTDKVRRISISSSLFRIYDFASGVNFLVDTGSQISILPASKWDCEHRSKGSSLVAANGTAIASFGNRLMTLHFGVKSFKWNFMVADVTQPILGVDFLCAHSLLVDFKRRRLFNA